MHCYSNLGVTERFILSMVLELTGLRCLVTKPAGVACVWDQDLILLIECEFEFLHTRDAYVEFV
jgi:hypothetical protein